MVSGVVVSWYPAWCLGIQRGGILVSRVRGTWSVQQCERNGVDGGGAIIKFTSQTKWSMFDALFQRPLFDTKFPS